MRDKWHVRKGFASGLIPRRRRRGRIEARWARTRGRHARGIPRRRRRGHIEPERNSNGFAPDELPAGAWTTASL